MHFFTSENQLPSFLVSHSLLLSMPPVEAHLAEAPRGSTVEEASPRLA